MREPTNDGDHHRARGSRPCTWTSRLYTWTWIETGGSDSTASQRNSGGRSRGYLRFYSDSADLCRLELPDLRFGRSPRRVLPQQLQLGKLREHLDHHRSWERNSKQPDRSRQRRRHVGSSRPSHRVWLRPVHFLWPDRDPARPSGRAVSSRNVDGTAGVCGVCLGGYLSWSYCD